MNTTLWRLGLLQALLLAASGPAQAGSASPCLVEAPSAVERFDEAMQAYERNHWPQAFDAFALLSEAGHANAARMVMQMHRHGPRLYGQQFPLTTLQLQRLAQIRQRNEALPIDAKR